jgi:hypothetical protein
MKSWIAPFLVGALLSSRLGVADEPPWRLLIPPFAIAPPQQQPQPNVRYVEHQRWFWELTVGGLGVFTVFFGLTCLGAISGDSSWCIPVAGPILGDLHSSAHSKAVDDNGTPIFIIDSVIQGAGLAVALVGLMAKRTVRLKVTDPPAVTLAPGLGGLALSGRF